MITRVDCDKSKYPLMIMWGEYQGGKCEYFQDKVSTLKKYPAMFGGRYDRYKIFKTPDEFYNWITNFKRDEAMQAKFMEKFIIYVSIFGKKKVKKNNLITRLFSILW
jgi:hypothetical protein